MTSAFPHPAAADGSPPTAAAQPSVARSAVARPPALRARFGWIFAAVWLFYLAENVRALLAYPGRWWTAIGLLAVVVFAACYMLLVSRVGQERRTGRWWLGIVALLALFGLQVPGAGSHALTCLVYVAATAMVNLPVRQSVPFAVVLVAAAELLPVMVPGWTDNGYGLAVLLGSVATYGIRLAADRQHRLTAAQRELAELAVQDERARIARDLHDILGHSLTVVAVKAELAQRLLDVDLGRARRELRDLEALARDALSDVRSTAMGVRGISLAGEIAAAREALAAADVEAVLPGAADEVPSANRELFAWAIREAVTNIVRHSRARHAEVRLGPTSVEILDDGVGCPAPGDPPAARAAPTTKRAEPTLLLQVSGRERTGRDRWQPSKQQTAGHEPPGGEPIGREPAGHEPVEREPVEREPVGQGLAGLRRRAEARGAWLIAGGRPGGPGFRVRVEVPR